MYVCMYLLVILFLLLLLLLLLLLAEDGVREEKPKWKFLQKYYHKGVFYMDSSCMKDPNDVRYIQSSFPVHILTEPQCGDEMVI